MKNYSFIFTKLDFARIRFEDGTEGFVSGIDHATLAKKPKLVKSGYFAEKSGIEYYNAILSQGTSEAEVLDDIWDAIQ